MQCMGMPQVYSVRDWRGCSPLMMLHIFFSGTNDGISLCSQAVWEERKAEWSPFLPIHARLLVNACWTSIAASIQVEANYVPQITIENVCHGYIWTIFLFPLWRAVKKILKAEPLSVHVPLALETWGQINITWEWRKFMMSNTQYLFSHDVCDIYILTQKLWVPTN